MDYGIRYASCISQSDDEWVLVVVNEEGTSIKLKVPTSQMRVRRDNIVIMPYWLIASIGLDSYSVPVMSKSEYSLGSLRHFHNGMYVMRSLRTDRVINVKVETSSHEDSWVYRGCRILKYENEHAKWIALGVIVNDAVRPFKTLTPDNDKMLRFLRDVLESPITQADKVVIQSSHPWCFICNEPVQHVKVLFCCDACKIKAGVE